MILTTQAFKKFIDYAAVNPAFKNYTERKISYALTEEKIIENSEKAATNMASAKTLPPTKKSIFPQNLSSLFSSGKSKISKPLPNMQNIEDQTEKGFKNAKINEQLQKMKFLLKNPLLVGVASAETEKKESGQKLKFEDPIAALIALHSVYGDVDVVQEKSGQSIFIFNKIGQDRVEHRVDASDIEDPYNNYVVEDLLVDLIRYYPDLTDWYLTELIRNNKGDDIERIRDLLNLLEKHITLKAKAMNSKDENYDGANALEKIKTLTEMLNAELLVSNLDPDLEKLKNLEASTKTTDSNTQKDKKRRYSNSEGTFKEPKNDIYTQALKEIEEKEPKANRADSNTNDWTGMYESFLQEAGALTSNAGKADVNTQYVEDTINEDNSICTYMHVFTCVDDKGNESVAILRKYKENDVENSYIQLGNEESQSAVLQIGEINQSKDGLETFELTLNDYDDNGENTTRSCIIKLDPENNALVAGYYNEGVPGSTDDDYAAAKKITSYQDPDVSASSSYRL